MILIQKAGGQGEAEEGAEAGTAAAIGYVPDLLADSKIYQWAGIGFGETETLFLQKSLKVLSTQTSAPSIRLWGKIQGLQKDYYIAEGTYNENQGEDEKPADFEPRGSGVNKFVYWATTSHIEMQWVQLPDLYPQDIKAAREVKVALSGDLERPIITNPFFFKKEKHYLRAQIARISQSTTLVPKGLYKITEDNDKEIEEIVPESGTLVLPSTLEMNNASNWVHHTQNILKCNRLAHIDQSGDDDSGELMKRLESADPYEKRLKPLTHDVKVKGGLPAWTVRLCGDQTNYASENLNNKTKVNYGVVVVRSLQWPGAYTLYTGGRWLQIYVGEGQKYEEATYYPIYPPKIQEDPEERNPYDEVRIQR